MLKTCYLTHKFYYMASELKDLKTIWCTDAITSTWCQMDRLHPLQPLELHGNIATNSNRFKQSFQICKMASGLDTKSEEVQSMTMLSNRPGSGRSVQYIPIVWTGMWGLWHRVSYSEVFVTKIRELLFAKKECYSGKTRVFRQKASWLRKFR